MTDHLGLPRVPAQTTDRGTNNIKGRKGSFEPLIHLLPRVKTRRSLSGTVLPIPIHAQVACASPSFVSQVKQTYRRHSHLCINRLLSPMNSTAKEIAKFACGFEAFHALFHVYVLFAKIPFRLMGIELTPQLSLLGILINGAAAISLGIFAWRTRRRV